MRAILITNDLSWWLYIHRELGRRGREGKLGYYHFKARALGNGEQLNLSFEECVKFYLPKGFSF